MLTRQEFIRLSLETNLFFQRLMKEHLFLVETNLPPVQAAYIDEANVLKQSFEQLLAQTVSYANGVVSTDAIKSNEFVTPYTLRAEEVTSMLTGASLDTSITKAELKLVGNSNCNNGEDLEGAVSDLNNRSLNLLEEVIAFQNKLLAEVLECKVFITLYPELLKHVTQETKYYQDLLTSYQDRQYPNKTLCVELTFWNHIMEEHAKFIDGMLDPSEEDLKEIAETFAEKFEQLVQECINSAEKQIALESLEATTEIRDFKKTATEGILACEIKSIIPPLLADHVLREANHYLRLLRNC